MKFNEVLKVFRYVRCDQICSDVLNTFELLTVASFQHLLAINSSSICLGDRDTQCVAKLTSL